MKRKDLYPGTDDYRDLIENNGYYVDKTLFIEEFLKNKAKVTLITRPRRFGKTLNLTMMSEFLDITKDSKDIFKGTKIMDTEYANMINSIPIILYSFKECNGADESELIMYLKDVLYSEYERFDLLFEDKDRIPGSIFKRFLQYKEVLEALDSRLDLLKYVIPNTIPLLTQVVHEYYKVKPIVMIDEYDNPFIEAKTNGYYEDVRIMLAGIFGSTCKGNKNIDRGLLTGIQRIAQESIFSKFNNPSVCTVVDKKYSDKFGLTEDETKKYLEYFGYELNEEVKEYYNGYKFFETNVYNPMSITSYIDNEGILQSYWINTSSNQLILDVIPKAQKAFRNQFEHLIKTGTAEIRIDFMTTFQEKPTVKGLWGLLVNAGYVTINKVISRKDSKYEVKIPNNEVNEAFRDVVALYINVDATILDELFGAMLDVDIEEFENRYRDILLENTSFHDGSQKENSYNMLMLGMCVYLKDKYIVKSNVESGKGRADIILSPKNDNDMNIILEFKSEENLTLETSANNAIKQIEDEKYYAGMKGKVLMLGIAHRGKECKVNNKMIEV